MKWQNTIPILLVLMCCYVAGPCVGGSYRNGDRRGPVIYPASFHETLYIIAHESSYQGEKPRIPLDSWMYRRPIFYGMSRRLKSESERLAIIERARKNSSSVADRMVKMNNELLSKLRSHDADR